MTLKCSQSEHDRVACHVFVMHSGLKFYVWLNESLLADSQPNRQSDVKRGYFWYLSHLLDFFFFFSPGFRIAAAFCRCAISSTFNSLNRPECTEARNMLSFENELQGSQSSFADLKILGYLIKKLKGWAKLACVHKKMRNFNYPSQDVFWYETSHHLADNFVAFTTYS